MIPALAGGWVDLSGALKPVRLVLNASEDLDERWSVAFSERHSPGEYCTVALDEPLTDDHVLLEHSEQGRLFRMAAFDQAWDESDSDYDEDTEFSPWRSSNFFLLFRIIERSPQARFVRVGLGQCYGEEAQFLYEELNEETKQVLPCLRYEKGRHTIRVV